MKISTILVLGDFQEEPIVESVKEYLSSKDDLLLEVTYLSKLQTITDDTIYLLYLSDNEVKELYQLDISTRMQIGIIPNEKCPITIRSYGINNDVFQAIDDILNSSKADAVDMLRCNDLPVLGNIIIGNVHGMNQVCNKCKNLFTRISAFFSDLTHLSFQSYTITTSKGRISNTAATGIMIFEHNVSGTSHNLLNENLSLNDGKLYALILAPSSIISYLYYLFISYFLNKIFMNNLPESIGLIGSSKLDISSTEPITYMIDGEIKTEEKITLEVFPGVLKVYLGKNISNQAQQSVQEEDKETIRINGLPKSEMSKMLVSETVPFLPKADEEDFKELFISLRQSGKLSSTFIVLMILSTLLATTGLFQSSAPVIIGAMILAPLMSPIISFSMGVLRGEKELLKESTITLFFGIFIALLFSSLYTSYMPLTILTDEMKSRLNPNVLDLMVAIISGIAGAYAYAKSEIAKSLAGVAIAVALVPPLSVIGIGISWWDSEIIYGSSLLFMTNLAGITLAASLTFLILGFAPIKRATKGIIYTSIFLIIVTIPLFLSFNKVIEQNKIFTQLKNLEYRVVNTQKIYIIVRSVDLSKDKPVVYIQTRSRYILTDIQLQKIKEEINSVLQKNVTVNILSETEIN